MISSASFCAKLKSNSESCRNLARELDHAWPGCESVTKNLCGVKMIALWGKPFAGRKGARSRPRRSRMLWQAYSRLLQTHPMRTNSLSAGCIGAVGDSIAQRIEASHGHKRGGGDKFDLQRTAQMSAFCCTWLGAPQYVWFRFLARCFPDGTTRKLPKTLLVHLGLMAPTTNTLFFAYREAMRDAPHETWAARFSLRMRREFPPTTAYSLLFWTPAQTVNFMLVPLHLRPLYLNSMMVVWTTYLSIAGHRRY